MTRQSDPKNPPPPDSSLGGDYARDDYPSGLGGDYARESPEPGTGAPSDQYGSEKPSLPANGPVVPSPEKRA